jgi:hypothetical protein
MTRTVEVEFETRVKNPKTAINQFFRKHPDLEYWREVFEWMLENNVEFESDCWIDKANNIRNHDWTWALHFYIDEDHVYMCVVERA